MAVAQRLDLRQSQQLVMTPQLQQAIKMLQMSNLELTEFIKDEVERNPLLEIASGAAENVAPSGVDKAEAERPDAPAAESFSVIEETFDTGSENIFADEAAADAINARAEAAAVSGPAESGVGGDPGLGDPGLGASEAAAWATVGGGRGGGFDDLDASLEGRACREATLREHLLRQLGEATADPAARLIGAELIENLDDAGYCRQDLDEVAVRLGAGQTAVNAALALLQTFDPTGVGARSLQECLALQLSERDRLDPIMRAFLDQLPLLAKGDYARLQKICGVDLEDLRDMIAEVRGLDPKPGARFSGEAVAAVTPDVFVYENRAGGWSVELNTATLPRLLLNNSYAAEVLKSPRAGENKQIREYVSECQQTASWLMKSIDQRAKTILRVAAEIVRQQDEFFVRGVAGLRPLNLKQVADAVDMHESTVSRVTSNKYLSTPRGVFEFKYFFTPAIAATDGAASHAAEAVRHRIKMLIEGETADDVLSDDRIVSILRGAGVDIARRTVAKYREALNIPSSVQRRKVKAALLVLS